MGISYRIPFGIFRGIEGQKSPFFFFPQQNSMGCHGMNSHNLKSIYEMCSDKTKLHFLGVSHFELLYVYCTVCPEKLKD